MFNTTPITINNLRDLGFDLANEAEPSSAYVYKVSCLHGNELHLSASPVRLDSGEINVVLAVANVRGGHEPRPIKHSLTARNIGQLVFGLVKLSHLAGKVEARTEITDLLGNDRN